MVEKLSHGQIRRVRVTSMCETCQRTTFFVELTNAYGQTITPDSHCTGSVYTNGEGLSVEEARDRALIEAATWGSFLGVEVEPFLVDGVTIVPSMTFHTYDRPVDKPAPAIPSSPDGANQNTAFPFGEITVLLNRLRPWIEKAREDHYNQIKPLLLSMDGALAMLRNAVQPQQSEPYSMCEDEGCPHHGTPHVCRNVTPHNADMRVAETRS